MPSNRSPRNIVPMGVAVHQVDPSLLGRRLRDARLAAGLTQVELAQGVASRAYVSRIESGMRRPGLTMLTALCGRLGVEPSDLLADSADADPELELTLAEAELLLAGGHPSEAARRSTQLLTAALSKRNPGFAQRALLVKAAALLEQGDAELALPLLESMVPTDPPEPIDLEVLRTLCRCLLDLHDEWRAIEVGTRAVETAEEFGMSDLPAALDVTALLASAHLRVGNPGHAQMLCTEALTRISPLGLGSHLGSAFSRASARASTRGDLPRAVHLAEQATLIYELARLSGTFASLRALLRRTQGAQMTTIDQDLEQNGDRGSRFGRPQPFD